MKKDNENKYIGSIKARSAITKYKIEPRTAIEVYFCIASCIFLLVFSESATSFLIFSACFYIVYI